MSIQIVTKKVMDALRKHKEMAKSTSEFDPEEFVQAVNPENDAEKSKLLTPGKGLTQKKKLIIKKIQEAASQKSANNSYMETRSNIETQNLFGEYVD